MWVMQALEALRAMMNSTRRGSWQEMTDPRERVRLERRVRGLSARQAAALGGVSNTLWSSWERDESVPTGSKIRMAVATAFDWPTTWPEDLPPTLPAAESDRVAALERRVAVLEGAVTSLLQKAIDDEADEAPPSS
jgi:transcriptional regulator with XRE-family HTH domain